MYEGRHPHRELKVESPAGLRCTTRASIRWATLVRSKSFLPSLFATTPESPSINRLPHFGSAARRIQLNSSGWKPNSIKVLSVTSRARRQRYPYGLFREASRSLPIGQTTIDRLASDVRKKERCRTLDLFSVDVHATSLGLWSFSLVCRRFPTR